MATAPAEVAARVAGQLNLVQQELVRHRMQSLTCVDYDGYGALQGQWDTGQRRWAIPVTVADLERPVRAEVDAVLPTPTVGSVPAAGTPSAVTVPMFVSVAQGWVSPSLSGFDPLAPSTASTVTAVPQAFAFTPGDGSDPVWCSGPGILYDRWASTDDPWVQATWPQRCAYAYQMRTKNTDGTPVPGRPTAWPAQLTVQWNVVASSGASLPASRSAPFAREVIEIQTVIVDGHY